MPLQRRAAIRLLVALGFFMSSAITTVVAAPHLPATQPLSPPRKPALTYEPSLDHFPCLDLTIQAPIKVVRGQAATFRLAIENVCKRSVHIYHGAQPIADFFLIREDGAILWNSKLEGSPRLGILLRTKLHPGKVLTSVVRWPGHGNGGKRIPLKEYKSVPTGTYKIVGRFNLMVDSELGPFIDLDSVPKPLEVIPVNP